MIQTICQFGHEFHRCAVYNEKEQSTGLRPVRIRCASAGSVSGHVHARSGACREHAPRVILDLAAAAPASAVPVTGVPKGTHGGRASAQGARGFAFNTGTDMRHCSNRHRWLARLTFRFFPVLSFSRFLPWGRLRARVFLASLCAPAQFPVHVVARRHGCLTMLPRVAGRSALPAWGLVGTRLRPARARTRS